MKRDSVIFASEAPVVLDQVVYPEVSFDSGNNDFAPKVIDHEDLQSRFTEEPRFV
jgi:hypothetical protein